MTNYRMLIPGPVDVDDEVMKVLGSPLKPHYGDEFAALYADVVADLKLLFGTKSSVFPIVGSGTTALEVAIGSMIAKGKRVAIVRNGWFGQHMGNIATARGIDVHYIDGEWGRAIKVDQVRKELAEHGPFDALLFVYAETSTGALNPAKELAALAKSLGIPVIVDAITGFAGTPLEVDAWDIDVCLSASQKALAAPPGLGFIAVSQKGWDYMESHPVGPIGWSTDLRNIKKAAEAAEHPTPATVPPNLFAAVQCRLKQVLKMGKQGYVDHHYRAATRFRNGLKSMGIEALVPMDEATPQVTSVVIPEGKSVAEIRKVMKERYGFYTAGGIGPLATKIMRVGHMGKGASDAYIDDALEAFGDLLR